jgi:HNH endonuclease
MGTQHSTPFYVRFWRKVNKDGPDGLHFSTKQSMGPCWLWTGKINAHGYGAFHIAWVNGASRTKLAHRFAFEDLFDPIPPGLCLDHLCRVRHCVNPKHLEIVTPEENTSRAASIRPERTHCSVGHELTSDNVYVSERIVNGRPYVNRVCRTCTIQRERDRRARRRVA